MSTEYYLIDAGDKYIVVDENQNVLATSDYKKNPLSTTKERDNSFIKIDLKKCKLLFKIEKLIELSPFGVNCIKLTEYENDFEFNKENQEIISGSRIDNFFPRYNRLFPLYGCQMCAWAATSAYFISNKFILRCENHKINDITKVVNEFSWDITK